MVTSAQKRARGTRACDLERAAREAKLRAARDVDAYITQIIRLLRTAMASGKPSIGITEIVGPLPPGLVVQELILHARQTCRQRPHRYQVSYLSVTRVGFLRKRWLLVAELRSEWH